MAKIEEDLDLDVEAEAKPKGGGWKKIALFASLGILVIGISLGTTLFLMGGDEAAEGDEAVAQETGKKDKTKKSAADKKTKTVGKTPVYLELDPPFVVNLNDDSGVRFLQVAVAVMAYSDADLEKVRQNLPLVRHHLMLLFSSQQFAMIKTIEGKERLQSEALQAVQKALKQAIGEPVIEALYLPSIVGQ